MTDRTVGLAFGAFGPSLGEQLAEQGLRVESGKLEHFEKDAAAIRRLKIRGLIGESACDAGYRKLLKKILAQAEPLQPVASGKP